MLQCFSWGAKKWRFYMYNRWFYVVSTDLMCPRPLSHCPIVFLGHTPRRARGFAFTHAVHVNRHNTGAQIAQICARFSTSYSSSVTSPERWVIVSTETGLTFKELAGVQGESLRISTHCYVTSCLQPGASVAHGEQSTRVMTSPTWRKYNPRNLILD